MGSSKRMRNLPSLSGAVVGGLLACTQVRAFVPNLAAPMPGRDAALKCRKAFPYSTPVLMAAGTQEKGSGDKATLQKDETAEAQAFAGALEEQIDRPKAKAQPGETRAAQARQERAAARQKKKLFINPIEIPIKAGQAARRALEALGKSREPAPSAPDAYRLYFDQKFLYAVPTPNDTTPTVLVVGASGETGRQAVRKLILKGYRVQVLVRKLYSTTLNMLGTGVSYVRGDLTDPESLKKACDGVDKILFLAQARNDTEARTVESRGLRNLVQAFQDTRITETGKRLTTKRTLFKFRKNVDFRAWSVASMTDGAEATWSVSDAKAGRPSFTGSFASGGKGRAVLESKKVALDLSRFGGFVALFKTGGEPSVGHKFVMRTGASMAGGYQFEIALPPVRNRFLAFRMNFKDFVPVMEDGSPFRPTVTTPRPVFDPADVKQLAIVAASEGTGAPAEGSRAVFELTLEGIKVFRTRSDPDIVLLSSSDITPLLPYKKLSEAESDERERVERRYFYKSQGELALKISGLSYCIIRMSDFNSSPIEGRPLSVSRNGNNMGLISRGDAAEVCVNCLFNSEVTNAELYASENPRYGERNIPALLKAAMAQS